MLAPSKPTPSHPNTPLLDLMRERIAADGPLTIAEFMELALSHPDHGYYQNHDPFGAGGDFVTAPEVSQTFGELIGLWLATAWQEAGRPQSFRLVEFGPGRGQLMADLLRATSNVQGFLKAADIHLVDISERLRLKQRQKLAGADITWHDSLETVPAGPLFLIANECFDALPTHQLLRSGAGLAEPGAGWAESEAGRAELEAGWAERQITCDDEGNLVFTRGDAPVALIKALESLSKTEPGQIAELSPLREALSRKIGERLKQDGGVAVVIDYGAWVERATGDTLQAVRDHRTVEPLATPGDADLTTQVDFRRLGVAAVQGGADVYGPVPQGTFLRTLGIEVRTAALLKHADEQQRQSLREGLFRLTDASAMGELFKVMVLAPAGGPPPPGFGAATLKAQPKSS